MSLKDIPFPVAIDTDDGNPIELFFSPCLKESIQYDVAVGYFTSGWIRNAAEGIAAFASNGGHSRWIISPDINEEDRKVLCNPNPPNRDEIDRIFSQSIDKLIDQFKSNTRDMLCYLIHDKILEFKFAVLKNNSGIFHVKRGCFTDSEGNSVTFNGSYNKTKSANDSNWESFDIATSWESPERVEWAKEKFFEKIWNKKSPALVIYDPTEIIIERISNKKSSVRPYKIKEISVKKVSKPIEINIRGYQKEAINKWFENNGIGMYIMATGTGKTTTTLITIVQLIDHCKKNGHGLFILIVAPFLHLVEQWKNECVKFGITPIVCKDAETTWSSKLVEKVNSYNTGIIENVFVISTDVTFKLDKLQQVIKSVNRNFFFIADEAHHLESDKAMKKLPDNAKFRLGLTATPGSNDEYDEDNVLDKNRHENILSEYFGKPAINFTLEQAIQQKFLSEYNYHPIFCELNETERDEYKILSQQLAIAVAQSPNKLSDKAKGLINKRSQLLSLVNSKLDKLEAELSKNQPVKHTLIYCGAARDNNFQSRFDRHIDKVLNIAGNNIGIKIRKFTQDEDSPTRKEILTDFANKKIDAIAAIKCLDEGIDIPKTQYAYILASSKNPREFIQRRGRILRLAEGKSFAYIYDFICIFNKSDLGSDDDFSVERRLMSSELERASEFARSARNSGEALEKLRPYKERYNLLDH